MTDLEGKKARLEAEYRRRRKRKKIVLGALLGLLVVGIAAVVLSTRESIPGFDNKYSTGKSVNYSNRTVNMTDITPDIQIGGGQVKLPLAKLEQNNLVYAMYDPNRNIGQNQKGEPIMAFLTPAGRVTVAVSFCEPCFSRQFHIEGDQLVCNTCGTRWALADMSGISGGCVKYPPQQLSYTADKAGDIVISETDLKNWQPRD